MIAPVSPESDTLLRRRKLSRHLTDAGYPITAEQLRKLARNGPPYSLTESRIALYRWADALAWAKVHLSRPDGS